MRIRIKTSILIAAVISSFLSSCANQPEDFRTTIDLSGQWQFSLDTADTGIEQKWFSRNLADAISLPGTTDLNRKGYKNKDTTTMHLNRLYIYEGAAWYKRKIVIPQDWKNKRIALFMERTKPSKIWVDSNYAGKSLLLESPQEYDLTKFLKPGEHTIAIRIDNDLDLTPYGNVHIYTDETQTNWNGIIGKFYLEASDKTFIKDVQVYPDIDKRKIAVRLAVENGLNLDKINIELNVSKEAGDGLTNLKTANFSLPCDSIITLEYELGDEMDLWDEYSRAIYTLNTVISNESGVKDNMRVPFGMRKFSAKGTQFTINGRTTFLRGKHDGCVFPLTGHPPMDVESWRRVFRIAKSYGINHYRFHTWSPPQAAFEAADELGIYMLPELPFWGGLESDTLANMLMEEGAALLRNYANHPSFVMFSPGNEIWSGHERVRKIMTELKKIDNRPLYTQGANNNIGYAELMDYEDFHIAARTPYAHDTTLTHIRLTHAFADSRDGGILNTQEPSTTINFDYAVSQIKIPLIAHEIGQYQIYPDYSEIKKYTGATRAWNLEVFRGRLKKAGMLDQDSAFQNASGAWAALCYKAEIEAALRTKGFAGFQLLDLQDYPGQGTALVGILDAFMDSKNVISREEWLQSCNDVTLLLLFKKYCWTNDKTFTADLEAANYSNKDITGKILWSISDGGKNIIKQGVFAGKKINMGGLNSIGKIQIPLADIKTPQKLFVNVSIENTGYKNSYPIWIYPKLAAAENKENIIIATKPDRQLIDELQKGNKVLLLPDENSVKENSVWGLFPPDFWNYGMFKGISELVKKPVSPGTLGILTDPKHPIFNSFPTDYHTNWQWFSIIKESNPLILDAAKNDYRPIVQVIDNLERNHKLGLIFEFKIGKGKLLVCMSQLNKILYKPEAVQLYHSILDYMKSDKFNPVYEADAAALRNLLK